MAREGDYVPIPCADYEPLEVVCMDHYAVELTTHNGRTIVGSAVDLVVRAAAEFLLIRHGDGTTEEVRVDQIRHMVVLSRPCRFNNHSFGIPAGE